MLDPNIPLQVQTPQPANPIATLGSLMTLRNTASEVALRQQQAADLQAQAQQRNRDLADQNTIQEALKDPAKQAKIYSGDTSPITGMVTPTAELALKTNVNNLLDKEATRSGTELANRSNAAGQIGKSVDSLKQMRKADGSLDLDAVNAQLPNVVSGLANAGAFKDLGIAPPPPGTRITSEEDLNKIAGSAGALGVVADTALARKKEKQGIDTAAAQQTEATARAGQAQAETGLANFRLNAAQQAAAGGVNDPEGAVASLIDPNKFPTAYAHAVAAGKLAMKGADPTIPGSQAKAFSEAVEKVHQSEVLPNLPETRAGKAAQAAADASATAPIDTRRALLVAATNRGQTGADKLDADYNQARTAVETAGHAIDMIDQGNKFANGAMKVLSTGATNALEGFKRYTSQEGAAFAGTDAGNLGDQIRGKIEKAIQGDSSVIPEIREDMRKYQQMLGEGAYNKYTTGLKALEQRTGTPLPPTVPAPNIRSSTGGASSGTPTPITQAEYNALPKGSKFKKPNDSTVYTKQ